MSKAIVISRHGGPEVLEFREREVGDPGPGELRLRHTAIGVNYHDIYVRSGQYPNALALPGIPGIEACGVVEAVGPGVTDFRPGDRVGYITSRYGCYGEERLLDARLAVALPADVPDKVAASVLLKGTTTAMLLCQVAAVQPGDTLLVHAAAGGMGRLLARWAKRIGATVIGTVGSAPKMRIASDAGCDHVIDYSREDFAPRVREITKGEGVRIAYDSVGRTTFSGTLECLAKRGHLVSFGQSAGAVAPVTMEQLSAKSLTVSRPIIFHYAESRAALESLMAQVFEAIRNGSIGQDATRDYALKDAAQAHRDLESRVPMGAPILIP
jgi:NADPH2:quinone reductase